MDLLQLKYFQVVAKTENITRAAQELYITQPSLSIMISNLEKSIGLPLFEREGRRIRLNSFGQSFLVVVNNALKMLEDGKLEILEKAGLECGEVALGTTVPYRIPTLLSSYFLLHPLIKMRYLHMRQHAKLSDMLFNGEIDICISTTPFDDTKINCELLAVERIVFIVPPDHHLASRTSIQLKEASMEPLLQLTDECEFAQITNKLCQKAEITPNILFVSPTPEIVCQLVDAGYGCAFIPISWLERLQHKSLVKIYIDDPDCYRNIWLSWHNKRYLSLAARDFCRYALDFLRQAESPLAG